MNNISQKRVGNTLTIRLTEPVVFLNAGHTSHNERRPTHSEPGPPSVLRGLLILDLAKPTRISSIEVELQGKTHSAWRDGIGPRSIEVTEDHKLFSASTVFFRADSSSNNRRTESVGPGLTSQDRWIMDGNNNDNDVHPIISRNRRGQRSASVDSSIHQSSHLFHREVRHLPPTLIYPPPDVTTNSNLSSSSLSQSSSSSRGRDSIARRDQSPGQSLSDFRNALRAGLETRSSSRHSLLSSPIEDHGFEDNSSTQTSAGVSHNLGIGDVPEESAVGYDEISRPRPPSSPPTYRRPVSVSSSSRYPSSPPSVIGPRSSSRTPISSRNNDRDRGPKNSRFLLTPILDAFKDVGPKSSRGDVEGRRMSFDGERGRPLSKGSGRDNENVGELERGREREREGRGKSALRKFSGLLRLDGEENKESGDGWKEFKKGVYTYPISIAIPGDSPPSFTCTSGSVSWRLKAKVHRPGALTTKLCATQEVILVAAPGEEDSEDTGNIIVDQMWELQLKYLITISGRSFPIGGLIPVYFTLIPLAKVKIFRISVSLEERVHYYTQMDRVARTESKNIPLLSLRFPSRELEGDPLLPLTTSFERSPLYAMVTPEDDASQMAASFIGPGPWSFHHNLKLPSSCTQLHFTMRNRNANITISHTLKIVLRAQKGDNPSKDIKSGKPTFYDIVIGKQVQILSCRCNWEWTALPRYTRSFAGDATTAQGCPCTMGRKGPQDTDPDRGRHNNATTVPRRPQNDSLYQQNTQFERLIAGQESEVGDAPPSYDSATAVAQGSRIEVV